MRLGRTFGFAVLQFLAPGLMFGQPHAELELVRGYSSDVTIPLSDLTRRSLEYSSLPPDFSYGMGFSASVVNHGPDTASNVHVDLDVLVDGEYWQTFSTDTIPQLPPGATDTFVGVTDLDLWMGGSVEFQFRVTASSWDSIQLNNTDTVDFEITGEEYARYSDGWADGIPSPSQLGYSAATRFEVPGENAISSCVLAFVMPYSDAGIVSIPEGSILNADFSVVSSTFVTWLEDESDLSLPGETRWIIAASEDNTMLEPGHDYYAAFSGFVPGAEVAYHTDCIDSTAYLYDDSTGVWNMLHVTPMIKVILVEKGYCASAIKEPAVTGLRALPCAPDPCWSTTHVRYSTSEIENVTLVVRGQSGAIIESFDLGKQPAGNHDHVLTVGELAAGFYSVSIGTENQRCVQRLMVLPH